MTRQTPPAAALREAIAETMWAALSAHDVPRACDALGMHQGTPDLDPMLSKRRYVRDRLMRASGSELVGMVRKVAEEYADAELAALVGPRSIRGVAGELKNLIFAAHGGKPRIVLRDALNNVIEIVENADKCLVYDRPLDGGGLSWGQLKAWWAERFPEAGPDPARSLFLRLRASLGSPVERVLFNAYGVRYRDANADTIPPPCSPRSTCTTTHTPCVS
jgi:hypothetical protein